MIGYWQIHHSILNYLKEWNEAGVIGVIAAAGTLAAVVVALLPKSKLGGQDRNLRWKSRLRLSKFPNNHSTAPEPPLPFSVRAALLCSRLLIGELR
jgi:hypothetical protein